MMRDGLAFGKARRSRFMAGTAALALFATGVGVTGVSAQDSSTDEEEVEEVVVTGSRIVRRDLTAPSPVTIVTSEAIIESGDIDITNVLREIPALNASLTASQSALTGAPNGVGQLNLRNLGTNRTLVLVNGRRHVAGVSGTASVDTSTIPVGLIETVETTLGTGGAVYGADAVSGVVNFILRDDFEGLEYRGQFNISDNGDAENYFGSITAGANFDDDRGNAVVAVEYSRQTPITGFDRSFAGAGQARQIPVNAEVAQLLGINPNAINTFTPNLSLPISSAFGIISLNGSGFVAGASGPGATFGGFPLAQVIDETGTLRALDFGVFVDAFNGIGGDQILAGTDRDLIIPELDRFHINANVNYELTENINFFLESKFVYTNSLDSTGVNGFNDDIPIALDNPFIPAALQTQIDSLVAQGLTPNIAISRDTLDDGTAGLNNADRFTFRAVTGFEGELDNGFRYELSYNFGRTDSSINNATRRIEDRFFAGIDAVTDPATGETVCRSDLDPTAIPPVSPFPAAREGFLTFNPGDGQCAPINIFGPNAISEEGLAFAFQPTTNNIQLTQQVILATISGDTEDFFSLPAGPIGFAAGFEYRDESSDLVIDGLETSGLVFLNGPGSTSVSGGFDVSEYFGEVSVPVLADLPLVQALTIDASVRYSDYSTVGGVTAWNAGATWTVTDDITFRGGFSRSVRAPNIFELFSGETPIAIAADFDPCNADQLSQGSEFRAANCAALGIPADFNSADFNSAFVPGTSGGNPNLDAERSETITIGAVFTPTFLPGFSLTVDYYDIEITDAIQSISQTAIIENCVDAPSLDNSFCPLVQRDPTNGNITGFTSGQANIASATARGVDFSAIYGFEVEEVTGNDWGDMQVSVGGTRFIERDDFEFQDFPDQVDQVLTELGNPRWIVNGTVNWNYEKFSATYQIRYQSNQLLSGVEVEEIAADPLFIDPFNTGDAFIHDISFRYQLNDNVSLRAGVNNIGDRTPFFSAITFPVGPIGRNFFFGITGRL